VLQRPKFPRITLRYINAGFYNNQVRNYLLVRMFNYGTRMAPG